MGKVITLVESNDCRASGTPVSCHVLKRIGEASLGFPDGEPYWFVCPRDPRGGKHRVSEHNSCEEADRARAQLPFPDRYVVIGPVYAPKQGTREVARGTEAVSAVVVDTPLKTITLTFDDESVDPVTLSAKEWDALFWGPVSVDKFAIPYYVGASGIEYGLTVHNTFHGTNVGCTAENESVGDATAYALVHEPDTDYTVFYLPGTGLVEAPQELPL